MKLNEYPTAIAAASRELVTAKAKRDEMEQAVSDRRTLLECQVAFDKELKNEAQRKAALAEQLMEDSTLNRAIVATRDVQMAVAEAGIVLTQLENEFSVAKINARHETAVLETQAN